MWVVRSAYSDSLSRPVQARRWLVCLFALALLPLLPKRADAQRGGDYGSHEATQPTRTSGFPGFFDANVSKVDKFSVDLPLMNVWYGATENFSIGTVGFLLAPNLGGQPSANLQLRYRLWSRRDAVSTLTAMAGFVSFSQDDTQDEEEKFDFGILTSNTTLHRPWGSVTGSVIVGRLDYRLISLNEELMQRITGTTSMTGILLAGTYDRFFNKRFGAQATLASAVAAFASTDDPGGSVAVSVRDIQGIADRSFARAMLQVRLGNWLLAGGGMALLSDLGAISPWASVQWSGR